MTWGKGGSTNVVYVTTNSRRAASVPIASVSYEPRVSYEPMIGSRTAHKVYSAKEDTDNMFQTSRRQDERLLRDIQTRLETAAFKQPAMREPRSRSRRPSCPSSRRGSVSSVTSQPGFRRNSLADEDFEIFFPQKLTTKNLPPCARRALNRGTFERSASVPPSPPSRQTRSTSSTAYMSSGGGLIDLGSPLFRVVDGGPVVKPSYMSTYAKGNEAKSRLKPKPSEDAFLRPVPMAKRRYSFAFEKPEEFRWNDDYTPQLRTAHAYEITTPRPFVRRHVPLQMPASHSHVFRGEVDYVPASLTSGFRTASEPRRREYPVASLAVRQARDSLGRIERELGMGSVSLDNDAPYIDEPIVHATQIMPVSATRPGWVRGSVASGRRPSYTYGMTSRPPPAPRSTRQHEIEARLEMMIMPDSVAPPVSYADLRNRTNQARNKMDQHRTLLDRYLPCPTGPVNDVPYEVEYKFNELADRMPQLRPRERSYRASSLPPIRPTTTPTVGRTPVNEYNNALRTPAFRPTMSDTRKRAREVLCRTKRDPHYFDY